MSYHRIGAQYQATPPTVGDKQISELQVDANGRLLVSGGAGTSSVTIQGAAADDAAATGNPVLVAGKYESTLNTQETGDVSTLKTDAQGALYTTLKPTGAVATSVASSATSVTILAANANRRGASIVNASTAILYLYLTTAGTAATVTTAHTVQLPTLGYYEVPFGYAGIITGIWASANGSANITEFS